MIKLSILALYYDLFGSSVRYRIIIWILTGIVGVWWLAYTILNFNICDPLSDIWDLSPSNTHHCLEGPHYLINGLVNVLTDALILCLPMRVVWGMQLPPRAKIGLSFIFLLGSM